MGSALEKHRGSHLDKSVCNAALRCSANNGWTTEQLRGSCKLKHAVLQPGSFVLNQDETFLLFSFLQQQPVKQPTPKPHKTMAKEPSKSLGPNSSTDQLNQRNEPHHTKKTRPFKRLTKSASTPGVLARGRSKKRKPAVAAVSSNAQRSTQRSTTRSTPVKHPSSRLSRSASTSVLGSQAGHQTQKQEGHGAKATKTHKKRQARRLLLPISDCKTLLFDAFKQRNNRQGHEASFFVVAVGLGLCAKSSMESRLHYLYDLFHPHDGYGGVEKPINMDSDSNNRVLSTKELIFMSFTTLRALNGIMHGHVDHIPITMHDVKHAMLTLVKNMEIATRE